VELSTQQLTDETVPTKSQPPIPAGTFHVVGKDTIKDTQIYWLSKGGKASKPVVSKMLGLSVFGEFGTNQVGL